METRPEDSTTLYFYTRHRKSPFFEATRSAGCKAYGIYNHMYLPARYDDPVAEYWHLTNHVTLWDVAVERVVEITGPDASAFTNMLTPRDLTKCAVGQGKYVLITAEDGGIVTGARDEFLLAATVQNLKRLIKHAGPAPPILMAA